MKTLSRIHICHVLLFVSCVATQDTDVRSEEGIGVVDVPEPVPEPSPIPVPSPSPIPIPVPSPSPTPIPVPSPSPVLAPMLVPSPSIQPRQKYDVSEEATMQGLYLTETPDRTVSSVAMPVPHRVFARAVLRDAGNRDPVSVSTPSPPYRNW